jgi:hypothetical protein
MVGDKTFSDFLYAASAVNAVAVPASSLTYMTIDNGPSAIGFLFSVPLAAAAGGVNTISLGYAVTGPDINDAGVSLAGVAAAGSGAAATIGETICPGGAVATCVSSLPLSAFLIAGGASKPSDHVTFSPVGTVGVLKGLTVVGGSGFANISSFTDTISEVPEPGFYGVLAGGMGAVLMFVRRRKKTV